MSSNKRVECEIATKGALKVSDECLKIKKLFKFKALEFLKVHRSLKAFKAPRKLLSYCANIRKKTFRKRKKMLQFYGVRGLA